MDSTLAQLIGASPDYIKQQEAKQKAEIERRRELYKSAPHVALAGRTVILVDDGIARPGHRARGAAGASSGPPRLDRARHTRGTSGIPHAAAPAVRSDRLPCDARSILRGWIALQRLLADGGRGRRAISGGGAVGRERALLIGPPVIYEFSVTAGW